jgi:glycosyltransferase involved in cell wall biosynthesis
MKDEYGERFEEKIDNGAKALSKSPLFDETKEFFDSLRDTPDTKIFVSVGRLTNQKNYTMMIEVFEELIDEGEDIKLVIVGSKTNDAFYAKKCEEKLTKNEQIILAGEKSNIGDYLINCDTFCLSSIYEGMPISILEAMSVGKPTISTPVGGVVDIISEGVSGYLSEDVSAKSNKEAIKRFLENPTHDSQKTIQHYKDNYSIEKTAAEYLDLYKRVGIKS